MYTFHYSLIYTFNFSTRQFAKHSIPNNPLSRSYRLLKLVTYKGLIYAFGGTTSTDLYCFDPRSFSFALVPTLANPSARVGHGMLVRKPSNAEHASIIVFCGFYNKMFLHDMHEFPLKHFSNNLEFSMTAWKPVQLVEPLPAHSAFSYEYNECEDAIYTLGANSPRHFLKFSFHTGKTTLIHTFPNEQTHWTGLGSFGTSKMLVLLHDRQLTLDTLTPQDLKTVSVSYNLEEWRDHSIKRLGRNKIVLVGGSAKNKYALAVHVLEFKEENTNIEQYHSNLLNMKKFCNVTVITQPSSKNE